MNVFVNGAITPGDDPLGLCELPVPEPDAGSLEKDWEAVSVALEAGDKRRRQWWVSTLAAAATVVLVIAVLALPRMNPDVGSAEPQIASETTAPAPGSPVEQSSQDVAQTTTEDLIVMSQTIEQQLRFVRSQVGSMPSELVIYQVELQDLIGQLDDALSVAPDSQELWGQRLGLQMDLMKLYRNQLRRDYHYLASMQ